MFFPKTKPLPAGAIISPLSKEAVWAVKFKDQKGRSALRSSPFGTIHRRSREEIQAAMQELGLEGEPIQIQTLRVKSAHQKHGSYIEQEI